MAKWVAFGFKDIKEEEVCALGRRLLLHSFVGVVSTVDRVFRQEDNVLTLHKIREDTTIAERQVCS